MSAVSRLWGVGGPSLSIVVLSASPQVLYRWWARMAPTGWQLAGSPCRLGALGDLWLLDCGPQLALPCWHMPV